MSRSVGLRRPAGGPWTRFLQLVGRSWFRSVGAALPFWRPELCPGLAGRPWQYLSPLPARASWSASTCRPGSSQPTDSLPSLPRPSTPGGPESPGTGLFRGAPPNVSSWSARHPEGQARGALIGGGGTKGPAHCAVGAACAGRRVRGAVSLAGPWPRRSLTDSARRLSHSPPLCHPDIPARPLLPSLGPLSSRAAATYSS